MMRISNVLSYVLVSLLFLLWVSACSAPKDENESSTNAEVARCDSLAKGYPSDEVIQGCVAVYKDNWDTLSPEQKWTAYDFASAIRDLNLIEYAQKELCDKALRAESYELNVEADLNDDEELLDDERLILPIAQYQYLVNELVGSEKVEFLKATVLTLLDNIALKALKDLQELDSNELKLLVSDVNNRIEANELQVADNKILDRFKELYVK